MSMVTDVISTIMDSLQAVFTGIGTSLTDLWESLIYDSSTGLTPFATWMLIFMGFSLGIGILFAVLRKVI